MPSAPRECVEVVDTAFKDAMSQQPPNASIVPKSVLGRRLANVESAITGRIPGEMGIIGDQRYIVEESVRNVSAPDIDRIGRGLDRRFAAELPTINYNGKLPKGIGQDTMDRALASHKAKVVVQNPELFDNISPELRALLEESQTFQRQKLGIAESLGYPIEAIDGPYLRQLWDIPEATISATVGTRGRVSIAKERVFGSILEGMQKGFTPTEHTVGELIESSSHLMDEAIADAFERQIILRRFGNKRAANFPKGEADFNHALYKGWSADRNVVNAVDQLHAPVGRGVRSMQGVAAALKNTVFGIADIGVFGVQVLRSIGLGGPQILAGAINRGLAARGLPHAQIWLADNMTKALQAQARGGVHFGVGPSSIQLKGGTIVKYIPGIGKKLDEPITRAIDKLTQIQFGNILSSVRMMRYEGDLAMLHLLGRNVNDPKVLRTAGDWANASTGASRGAQTGGRRAAETISLTSFQMTRSEMASWMQLAKATFNPKASATERILGITTLASLGAGVYGVGSAVNMAFGNGPIEWNPKDGKWATIQAGGQNIPIIPQRGLVRVIAKSIDAIQDEDIDKVVSVWTQFATSKLSPLAGTVPAAAGFGFEPGEGFKTGGLSREGRLLNIAPLPPIFEQALTEPEQRDAYSLSEAFIGLNPFPESEFEVVNEARADAIADTPDISGDYSGLSSVEKFKIDQDPRVIEALDTLGQREPRDRTDEGFQRVKAKTEEFQAAQQEDNDRLDEFFTSGGGFSPDRWQDREKQRARDRFTANETLREAFDIQYEDEKGQRPADRLDRAVDEYFSVDIDRFTEPDTLDVNWTDYFAARDRALAGLSDSDRQDVLDFIHQNETRLERDFRILREELDDYYAIPSEDRKGREKWRKRNARGDAILFITGSTTTLINSGSQSQAKKLVRSLFGSRASIPSGTRRSSGDSSGAGSFGGGEFGDGSFGGGSFGGGEFSP